MGNNLILCSGNMRREGWKTLDCNPAFEANYVAIIPPLPHTVKLQRWDEIEWVHGITSFYPWDAIEILTELRMALEINGKLVLEQPDFNKAIPKLEWIFGDPALKNPLHMNKWAWTPESLSKLLRDVGFSVVIVKPAKYHMPKRDFRIEAYI